MKETHIKEKLKEIGMPVEELSLGDFDVIGHYTAYKTRSPESSQYKTVGCFFRPNYERGLLIYSLIKKYNLKSYLEIGYGRGYSSMCAAKAFMELGEGKVTTVDPILEQDEINRVGSIFGKEMMDHITFIKATSQDYLPKVNETFDMVYIDGDHTIDAVRNDWEHTSIIDSYFLTITTRKKSRLILNVAK